VPAPARGIPRIGLAASAVVAAVLALAYRGPGAPAAPSFPQTIRGLDVSHYQGRVDWTRVAAAGYRFVYLKANEGRGVVDRTFARNAREAAAAGLLVGAYHFARPDGKPGDAAAEADAFLRVAPPRAGGLAPMLDLETAGTLGPRALQGWTRAWLIRVTQRAGIRPIIYAGWTFWRVHMDDTTGFVSYPLVLAGAHRDMRTPARDWSSFGWTIWQSSLCGDVPGIDGCVDLDLMRRDRVDLVTVG
jgi:lysozyme